MRQTQPSISFKIGDTIKVSTGVLTIKERIKGAYVLSYESTNPVYNNDRIVLDEKEVKRLMRYGKE